MLVVSCCRLERGSPSHFRRRSPPTPVGRGQKATALLSAPVMAHGTVLVAAGTNVRGTVIAAGRVDGRSRLAVRFESIVLSGADVRLDADEHLARHARAEEEQRRSGLGGKFQGPRVEDEERLTSPTRSVSMCGSPRARR